MDTHSDLNLQISLKFRTSRVSFDPSVTVEEHRGLHRLHKLKAEAARNIRLHKQRVSQVEDDIPDVVRKLDIQ